MTRRDQQREAARWPDWKHRDRTQSRHAWPRWEHNDHMHHWFRRQRRKRRFVFARFAAIFSFLALLVLGGMATLAFLFSRLFGGGGTTTLLVWLGGIGLALAFPIAAAAVALRAFREIAMPLADLMAAAEAVAQGDLTVRVPVYGGGEFGRLAEAFNHMVEELQRADQQRRNLTADVAHELRTPLQIIQGNLEGILDEVYEPTEEHLLSTIDETRSLARLVDDLRTLSLAEAGELHMASEAVNVAELLGDVQTSFSGQAEVAGIELRVEKHGDPEALTIKGDAGRLDQVVSNLVANALRFTPGGGTITLRAEPTAEGVHIIVSDTGEGIPAENLPYVFDRFWRGDRARSHTSGAGSGLGLAIARELVQAHGGHIRVESQIGQGTTFTIELPRALTGSHTEVDAKTAQ